MKVIKLYRDATKTFRIPVGDRYTTSVPNHSFGEIRFAEVETTMGEWYEEVLKEIKPARRDGFLVGETQLGEVILQAAQRDAGKKTFCYPVPKEDWEKVKDRQIKKTVLLRDQFIGKVKVGDEINRNVIVPQEHLVGHRLAEVK